MNKSGFDIFRQQPSFAAKEMQWQPRREEDMSFSLEPLVAALGKMKDSPVQGQAAPIGKYIDPNKGMDKIPATPRGSGVNSMSFSPLAAVGQQLSQMGRGRKMGGKVRAGEPYIVGEERPEVFVPETDGEVIPPRGQYIDPDRGAEGGYRPVEEAVIEEPVAEAPVTEGAGEPPIAAQIRKIQGKDYSKTRNADGSFTYGKDFDKKRNLKDALRGIAIGLTQGAANSRKGGNLGEVLGSTLGGGAAGGIGGAFVDNFDNKLMDEAKLGRLMPQYDVEQRLAKDSRGAQMDDAKIAYELARPDIAQAKQDLAEFKALNDADYKSNIIALGASKAEEIRKNNERIFTLKARGLDQNDKRIQLIEKRNNDILSEGEKNRINRKEVAQIGANSRKEVAGLNNQTKATITGVKTATDVAKVLAAIDNGPALPNESPEQTQARKTNARNKFIKDHEALMPK